MSRPSRPRHGTEVAAIAVASVALGAAWWSWSPTDSPLERAIADAGTDGTTVDLIAASGVSAESLVILCPYQPTDDATLAGSGVDGRDFDSPRDTESSLVFLEADAVTEVVRLRADRVDACNGIQDDVALPEFDDGEAVFSVVPGGDDGPLWRLDPS